VSSFQDLIAHSKRRTKGCPVCGERNVFQLMISLRPLNEFGTPKAGRSATKASSYCEEHGVAAFNRIIDEVGQ